jgi:hypothetical protein
MLLLDEGRPFCPFCEAGEKDEKTGKWLYPPMKVKMRWDTGDQCWVCPEDDEHWMGVDGLYYEPVPDNEGISDADPGL